MKVETLSRSDRSWNGDLLPKLNGVQAEITVLPITVPAASAPKGNPNKAADKIFTVRPLKTSSAPPYGIRIGDISAGSLLVS
ncbi:hypothetical protein KBY74_12895 [Cyanobium sp. A1C-AMD]|uniref:hypothetical protein n=1 Tax=Cyanobium sp. A1C-AMD TaxID=2823694 RepID=UPI0020CD2E18|nr:hypothetical protein [Cyanobium sp. A1C-AMD]MCP9880733.1 hypothetical protein [Cyanobium sp. A1C-AMD]